MIRADLLRAKTAQVSAAHRREVVALGRAREQQDATRGSVNLSRDRFWQEVAKASKAPRNGNAEMSLTRAREAGRLLKIAQLRHQQAEKKVITHVARALQADVVVKRFQALERKESRCLARHHEERQSEEIGEIAVAHSREARGPVVCALATVNQHSRATSHCSLPRSAADTGLGTPLSVDGIVVRGLEAGGARDLRLSCESSGHPFSCRVREDESGRVAITLESPHVEVCSRAFSARLALTSRLRSLGIELQSVKVSHSSQGGGASEGGLRFKRPRWEDDDESVIA